MPSNMGIDSLKANLTNPARGYLWEIIIPIPIGDGDSETYQIRAQSTQIPSVGATNIHIPYKQTAGIEIAGKKEYSHTWTCTFLEGEDHLVYDALYSWTQDIVDDVGGVGVGEPLYKTDVYLNLLTVEGNTYKKIKLKGCWLQNIGNRALSYQDNNVITFEAQFRFDSIEQS